MEWDEMEWGGVSVDGYVGVLVGFGWVRRIY